VYAEPNLRLHLLNLDPDDTYYASQWGLGAIAAPAGWPVYPGTFVPSPFGTVGIVDTGVDATHPDLQGRISSSSATCLASTCTPGIPTDDDGHGTHVAGIAGATADNGIGVAGLAYASPLIVVRVFDNSGSGAALSDVANHCLGRESRREGDQPQPRRREPRSGADHALQCGRARDEVIPLGRGRRRRKLDGRHEDVSGRLPRRGRSRGHRQRGPAGLVLELRQPGRVCLGARREHLLDVPGVIASGRVRPRGSSRLLLAVRHLDGCAIGHRSRRGQTTERLTVFRRARALRRVTGPLRPTDNAVAYWLLWRPAKRGTYRFRVRATDRAGNHSPQACKAIRVR
jgi:hypothetical protein